MQQEMMDALLRLADDGKLQPLISASLPATEVKAAYELIEQKKVLGKCCITFGEGEGGESKIKSKGAARGSRL